MTRLFAALAALAVMGLVATASEELGRDATLTSPTPGAAPPDTGVVTRRIFEGPGLEFWSKSVSPDGRYLTQWYPSTSELSVLDLLTGRQHRVRPEGAPSHPFVGSAAFSPDGRRIAYTSWEGPDYEIRLTDVDGAADELLWRGSHGAWPEVYSWSPDGEAVLAALWGASEHPEISFLPVDGSPRRVIHRPALGGMSFAALSPDGRFLAFTDMTEAPTPERPNPDIDVYVVPVDGNGRAVSVAPAPGQDELVGWTRDGRLLVASERELTEGIWSVDLRNGRPVGEPALVKGDLWGMYPVGMLGNTVFYGVPTRYRQVHTVPLSLRDRKLLGPLTPVEADIRPSSWPTWSPDGRSLAYTVVESFRGSRQYEKLVIRAVAGQEAREVDLERGAATSRGLAWAPGGDAIYFRGKLLAEDRMRGFAAFDLASGEVHTLYTFDQALCRDPAVFHPDGRRVFCARTNQELGRTELMELELGSLEMRLVWELGTLDAVRGLSVSPDGSRLAFWALDGSPQVSLQVLPIESGVPDPVFSFTPGDGVLTDCSQRPLWTPDGEQLLISLPQALEEGAAAGPEACPVYLLSASGGEPTRIGALPENWEWTISPDGTRLALVTGEARGELWVLEGAAR